VLFINKFLPKGLGEKLLKHTNRKAAKKIRKYIFKIRGLYIKVGQFLGMMTNLFIREFINELADLQDKVPPVPYKTIKKRFIKEWGKEPHEIFHTFEKTPIASASLGQVHVATLKDGLKLAVKALYPDIENIINTDLSSLKSITRLVNVLFPSLDMKVFYNEFSDIIKREVNYKTEIDNIKIFTENFKDDDDLIFPEVLEEYSSSTILTTKYIDGIKISHVEKIREAGMSTEKISKKLIGAYCKMIFEYQYYHADPHPGNFFVLPGHKIAFVDFGAVETISNKTRTIIKNLTRAIIHRDIPRIMEAIEKMGGFSKNADREDIENMISYRYDKLANLRIESYKDLNFKDFNDLEDLKALDLRLSEILNYFQIPHNMLLLGRTITLLSGLAVDLNPKVNIFQTAWPYLKDFFFGTQETVRSVITEDIIPLAKNITKVPGYALKTMDNINNGKVKITVKDFYKSTKKIYRLGHQLIYTLFTIAFLAFSATFHLHKDVKLSKYSLYAAGICAFFLIISMFKNRRF
jgi:predicted unusual protein kinase regulating ubiquinone biosynthesis (AarF/ABC1/UbiB family)